MRPVKTYDFILVLKQPPSYQYIDWISRLMLFMGIIAFLLEGVVRLHAHQPAELYFQYFFIAAAVIGWWIYCYLQSRAGKTPFYRFALMLAAWGWYFYPHGNYLAIVYLVAAVLEKPVKVQPEYAFDKELIVSNSFPQKKYRWAEVSNVVLKDGILTIDLKNNTIIQKEVNEEVPLQDETDFNGFCRQRLEETTI